MATTWIISADAGRARIFSAGNAADPLQEVQDMVNSASRMRTSETMTDKLGPTAAGKSSHSTGGALPNSQYEPNQTPEQVEAESFARDLCSFLLKAHHDGKYDHLALVAAPKFLGSLRSLLDPQLKALVSMEINKDYTHSNGRELQAQIKAHQAQQA